MSDDEFFMRRALELAERGQGRVEPNPMVGCVLVQNDTLIGEGWHERFGGPHAEVNAIAAATASLEGATAYVSLEPCSHHGKTPPCTIALIKAGIAKAVIAHPDPNPQVAGAGAQMLLDSGMAVESGVLQGEAADILAPYLKRMLTGIPWIIAKWAMTLDGKIATATGDSQWISSESSRAIVHQIRGRVDAIMVGYQTAAADDPLLNARPAGPRVATRIVLDSRARLKTKSKLCQTAKEIPTLIAVGPQAKAVDIERLSRSGCEVWQHESPIANERLLALLQHLSQCGNTNVMVEGGSGLFGSLNDLDQIDETHVFVGPQLLGGSQSLTAAAGLGNSKMADARKFRLCSVQQVADDVYIVGRRMSRTQ